MRKLLLLVGLAVLLGYPARSAWAQTCPCYGPNTCNGNCAGSVCCRFGCTNYDTDVNNCGSCGNDCGPQSTCVAGVCHCVPGTMRTWCYDGPPGTIDVGVCRAGNQVCTAGGAWGMCTGEILPTSETCNGLDDDCDGRVDNVPGTATPLSRPCYSGPAGTPGVGQCHVGRQVCTSGAFGACLNEVVPVPGAPCGTPQSCTTACLPDGGVADAGVGPDAAPPDAGVCVGGAACYEGPPGTSGVGVCSPGTLSCGAAGLTCSGQILPSAPRCDGLDHDCNGTPDTSCPSSQACSNGVCVPGCPPDPDGVPRACPTGYMCTAASTCEPVTCGAAVCPTGSVCVMGTCQPPCYGMCGPTEACFNDRCVPNDCTSFGCLSGSVCIDGLCRPDPCSTVTCGPEELCFGGACTKACAFVPCPTGESCGADGACHPDACAGVSCTYPTVCQNGACVADPCVSVTCPPAQICEAGACVNNACLGVTCPAGTSCRDGQCYGAAPPIDAGPDGDAGALGGNHGGCGCAVAARTGRGLSAGLLGLLALLVVFFRRSSFVRGQPKDRQDLP